MFLARIVSLNMTSASSTLRELVFLCFRPSNLPTFVFPTFGQRGDFLAGLALGVRHTWTQFVSDHYCATLGSKNHSRLVRSPQNTQKSIRDFRGGLLRFVTRSLLESHIALCSRGCKHLIIPFKSSECSALDKCKPKRATRPRNRGRVIGGDILGR